MAAKVDRADAAYFRDVIEPLLDDPSIEFIGEICDADKSRFLGNAVALLFPIDWPEPFGLVMVEALACGTPVIAWNHGSVSEVIEDGVTGRVVESLEQAIAAVDEVSRYDRARIRQRFEQRFSARTMALNYEALYLCLQSLGNIETRRQA
jgi:glycosyltransferase involved in cell wall biosynthesis